MSMREFSHFHTLLLIFVHLKVIVYLCYLANPPKIKTMNDCVLYNVIELLRFFVLKKLKITWLYTNFIYLIILFLHAR